MHNMKKKKRSKILILYQFFDQIKSLNNLFLSSRICEFNNLIQIVRNVFKYTISFRFVFVDANLERENHVRGERENLASQQVKF